MAEIRRIVIHCTDSPDSMDIGVDEIRVWHVRDRGWKDVGYHDVIRRSGLIEVGRFENGDSILEGKEIGAHVAGHNSDSIAICWVGRTEPTKVQYRGLLLAIALRMRRHNVPIDRVFGHKELAGGKTCPNLDCEKLRADVTQYIAWLRSSAAGDEWKKFSA